MPSKTVSGERLTGAPAVEILRGGLKADGSPDAKSFRVVETIPGALVVEYRAADKVEIINRVSPEELRAYPGGTFAYPVPPPSSPRHSSVASNTLTVPICPLPEHITA